MLLLLGIVNGLFSSAVLVALDRINLYYANLKYEENLKEVERVYQETGTHLLLYNPQPQPLWWVRVALFNIAMFAIATLIVHAVLARRIKSVFLIWLVIGAVVVAEWGITIAAIEAVESMVRGRRLLLLLPLSSSEGAVLAWYVMLTIATSMIFGMLIKATTVMYGKDQKEGG